LLSLLIGLLTVVAPAFAHENGADAHGLVHGLLHPLGGIDHVLAMVAVGVFAALLGGRAVWRVPAAFLGMMALGGVLGAFAVPLPMVETGIALSLVALGAALALRLRMATALAMGLAGFFAVFHGHAHGAEMPELASGLAYGAGFVLSTAGLHAAGLGLGSLRGRLDAGREFGLVRVVAALVALAGAGLLTGVI
jgi:urease accessory protein